MNKCICGCDEIEREKTLTGYITCQQEYGSSDVNVVECASCGLIRQKSIPFDNEKEYKDFYKNEYPPVKENYTIKDYNHDKDVAKQRFNTQPVSSGTLLDVGCGSGAFVDVCRGNSLKAFGCEIGKYFYSKNDKYIYNDSFENIHFPTDYFNTITCYDVIEHVLDPIRFMEEFFRVLKQQGKGIVEIPDFYASEGKHHWKANEHIWFFTIDVFKGFLEKIGFLVRKIEKPILSKVSFYVEKPKQKRVKILLPPGIGDVYWELVKLQSFLNQNNLGIPDVYVASRREKQFNAHKRVFPFLEMIPFVNSSGQVREMREKGAEIWDEAYKKCGKTIFENVLGCDYFISHNGYMGAGYSLEEVDSHLKCNWNLPMFESLEQQNYREAAIQKYGKYVVFYFVFQGTYRYWLDEFSEDKIVNYINAFVDKTKLTPVFVGAEWDNKNKTLTSLKRRVKSCVDLVGKTTLSEVFGLIKGSELVVGYPSGLTIMSAAFKKKTLMLWNNYYNSRFIWNVVSPDLRNKTYFTVNTKNLQVDSLTELSQDIIENKMVKGIRYVGYPPSENKRRKLISKKDKPDLKHLTRMGIENFANSKVPRKPKIVILCVLKSGGDFTAEYVIKLRNSIMRHSTIDHDFICLTDIDSVKNICRTISFSKATKGWWSKIELFRSDLADGDKFIYFDLDTIILKNVDDILLADYEMCALQPWNETNRREGLCASGMMAWRNDNRFSYIYDEFKGQKAGNYKKGDQEYISLKLKEKGDYFDFFQNKFGGIYSYKRNCLKNVPKDARIICFHGKPRPHEMKGKWIKENWR